MELSSQSRLFEFASIPMVGNLSNGAVIGLTEEGARVCSAMAEGGVPESAAAEADPSLLWCLIDGGFADEGASTP